MISRLARFLIHPVAVPRSAWNSTLGWNRQLVSCAETLRERIHPDVTPAELLRERLRQSAVLSAALAKGLQISAKILRQGEAFSQDD